MVGEGLIGDLVVELPLFELVEEEVVHPTKFSEERGVALGETAAHQELGGAQPVELAQELALRLDLNGLEFSSGEVE